MRQPQKSGVIVYSKDVKGLSQFYTKMFGMDLLRETDDFITLGSDQLNIVVHVPPIEVSEHNLNTVKVFLTVESLKKASAKTVKLGGKALEGQWSNPLFKVCNIADPEGNHIQLREFIR